MPGSLFIIFNGITIFGNGLYSFQWFLLYYFLLMCILFSLLFFSFSFFLMERSTDRWFSYFSFFFLFGYKEITFNLMDCLFLDFLSQSCINGLVFCLVSSINRSLHLWRSVLEFLFLHWLLHYYNGFLCFCLFLTV